jgi:hypothetical protein
VTNVCPVAVLVIELPTSTSSLAVPGRLDARETVSACGDAKLLTKWILYSSLCDSSSDAMLLSS